MRRGKKLVWRTWTVNGRVEPDPRSLSSGQMIILLWRETGQRMPEPKDVGRRKRILSA